jgi:multidrug efflux pump subunit AcrA (membrane-fusion protein)
MGAMAQQFGETGGGGRGGAKRMRPQTVWEPGSGPKSEPKSVEVRTGITDGRFTQIVSGDLKAGDVIITGLATAKAAATGASPMGAPGGGRRGF